MARYIGDPKYDPLFWLCLPIVLAYVVGKVALAWLKTKLPSRKIYWNHCRECGWELPDAVSRICSKCQEASVSKLFCCDVDLEYLGARSGSGTIDYRYRCPACGRIWLYISEWHKDSGREADWYPQRMETDGYGQLPDLYDERTRTKVYH